jgi:transposase
VWVFGLLDTRTNQCYVEIVPDRTALTLLTIIQKRVLPGSLIYSDEWAAYSKISELGYKHDTVNHSYCFVQPGSFVCTNAVENLWKQSKIVFKEINGCQRNSIQTRLEEFMWRVNNNLTRTDAYDKILREIAHYYSPANFQYIYIFVFYLFFGLLFLSTLV